MNYSGIKYSEVSHNNNNMLLSGAAVSWLAYLPQSHFGNATRFWVRSLVMPTSSGTVPWNRTPSVPLHSNLQSIIFSDADIFIFAMTSSPPHPPFYSVGSQCCVLSSRWLQWSPLWFSWISPGKAWDRIIRSFTAACPFYRFPINILTLLLRLVARNKVVDWDTMLQAGSRGFNFLWNHWIFKG
jgi:hypothetical protein